MKINLTSVMVNDQAKALDFYTSKLGFIKKQDIPMGEHRWLTIVPSDSTSDIELLLEPLGFEPAKDFQKALYDAGIPGTQFESSDIDNEVAQLKANGVNFKSDVKDIGTCKMAIFDDTCGNYICLVETKV